MFINHFYFQTCFIAYFSLFDIIQKCPFHINVTIEDDATFRLLSCFALYSLYVYRTVQLLYCLKVVTIYLK